ncbi:hypothetical protein BV509_05430 [Rhodovulum sulfidophilum]|nr:hypothetical protein BV509_05430 [Rhodovulum sulfidophilum]
MTLELLVAAQSVAAPEAEPGLPPDRLRFTLEYASPPDCDAQRTRLAGMLGGDHFSLEPLDPLLPQFLVLQFPGVRRRVSPEALFDAADTLVEEMQLVSAVPDIRASFVGAPEDPERVESVADAFLTLTCWVAKDEALPDDWAVSAINVKPVWARGITGQGVLVAQPDTGVADHPELAGALDLGHAWNTLTGTADPTDPLSTAMGNPGHGTATSSTVASRAPGRVFGAAPGAKVAPIRCLDAVVLGLDPTPVARAILHAVHAGADVISMSLGGALYSPALAAALKTAARAGIVIVSAAGNCVQPIVVYPARDPNVVGMAGTNHLDKPWKGTSRGRQVAAAAPAENVRVARRKPGDNGQGTTEPSQGTSFATALTAGVAALWVQHLGRQRVRDEAARIGITVTDLFRTALKATARRPAGWPQGMGAGIVDADALLRLDLSRISPLAAPESAPPPDDDAILAALEDSYDAIEMGDGDWPRVGTEAVYLLNDAWLRENRAAGVAVETTASPRPSAGLVRHMPEPVMRGLAARSDAGAFTPPLIAATGPSAQYAKLLAAGQPGTAESSANLTEHEARARLAGEGAGRLMARTRASLDRLQATGLGDRDAQARMLEGAEEVIRMAAENRLDELDLPGRITLEALVRIQDRPAFRVIDGSVDTDDPLAGDWAPFLGLVVDLPDWTRSVGRIDLDGTHIGTGFLIGGGRVMTNRHVLEACADELAGPGGSLWRLGRGAVTIDFSETADGSQRHALTGVVMAGPDPINGVERLGHLDMALLSLDATAPGLPRALPLARQMDEAADMVVIGYPARPGRSAFVDPATGAVSREIGNRLREIFGTDYGRKYVAPGRVIQGPGMLPGDSEGWAASHDCTTLGGNSGSVLVQFTATPSVAGLHFSGAPLTANKAHALGRVDQSPLGPITGAAWI